MRRLLAVLLLSAAPAATALAQQPAASGAPSGASGGDTVGALVAEGYEIRAAVQNAGRFVLFLQKDKTAYACDFATVSSSRCEQIN